MFEMTLNPDFPIHLAIQNNPLSLLAICVRYQETLLYKESKKTKVTGGGSTFNTSHPLYNLPWQRHPRAGSRAVSAASYLPGSACPCPSPLRFQAPVYLDGFFTSGSSPKSREKTSRTPREETHQTVGPRP